LRAGGGNHYTMWAKCRSDYSIIRHPEYQLGKIPAERDSFAGWNTCKGKHKPILSTEAKLIRASARQRSLPPSSGGQAALSKSSSTPAMVKSQADRDKASSSDSQPCRDDLDVQSVAAADLTVRMRQAQDRRRRCRTATSDLTAVPPTVPASHSLASVPGRMADMDRAYRHGSGYHREARYDPDFHIKRSSKTRPVGYGRFQYIPPESAKPFLQKWMQAELDLAEAQAAAGSG